MSQMRTDILGHSPSLCNCRRVWHPAIPTQPLRGCTCLKCTNQAATASSHSKRLLCILRVPWDNTTQPKHLCASVPSVGGLFRAATRTHPGGAAVSAAPTEQPLHLPTEFTEHTETSCRNVLPQNSQNFLAEENFCVFCVFRGTILRTLTICGRIRSWQVAWVWQGCHTLLSVFCGQYISAWLVQWGPRHPLREHL